MALLGHYSQDLDASARGPTTVLGLNMAYRYRFHDFEHDNDRLGLMHLPGPGLDFRYRSSGFALSTSWRVNADFAGMHSAAYGP